MNVICFAVGILIGATLGMVVISLCRMAAKSEKDELAEWSRSMYSPGKNQLESAN